MRICTSFVAVLILLATVCSAQNTLQKKEDVSLISRILEKKEDVSLISRILPTSRKVSVRKIRLRGDRRKLQEEEEESESIEGEEAEEVHENEFQFTGSASRRDPGDSWAMSVLGFGVACIAYGGLIILSKKRFQSKSLSVDLMQGDAEAGVVV